MARIITKGLIGMEDLSLGTSTFTRATSVGGTQTLTQINLPSSDVPLIVATANLTAQEAPILATTLYTVPVSAQGMYRMSVYVVLTRAGTVSSTIPTVNALWTDADTSVVGTANILTTTGSANTVGTTWTQLYTPPFYAKAGTAIQYSTTGYASSGATTMQYALHVKLEYLGA